MLMYDYIYISAVISKPQIGEEERVASIENLMRYQQQQQHQQQQQQQLTVGWSLISTLFLKMFRNLLQRLPSGSI